MEKKDSNLNEAKYQRLVEGLGDNFFVYSHDTKGVFDYVSSSITKMLGYSISDFTAHYSKYLTKNPFNKEVDKYTALSIRGIKQAPYLVEIYHKNGSIKVLEVNEIPIKDELGKVISVEGIAHDITKQYSTEHELRENEEKFKIIFNGVQDAIYFHEIPSKENIRGRFLEVNQAAIDRMGYTRKEFLEMDPINIDDAEAAKKVIPNITKELKEKGYAVFEMVHVAKTGKRIPVEINSRIVNTRDGLMMLSVARDLTARKKIDSELKEKVEEMEKLNNFMVGRELKMVELKAKIAALEEQNKKLNK